MVVEALKLVMVVCEGLLSFFSPCIVPILPVYLSLLSNTLEQESLHQKTLLKYTISFVLGISSTFFMLGLSVQTFSHFLKAYQPELSLLGGILIVVLGFFYMDFVQISFLNREKRWYFRPEKITLFSAYLLGLTFSFSWTPCIGPMLASVLLMAFESERSFQGNFLILLYTMGFTIPFLVMAVTYHRLVFLMNGMKKHFRQIKQVGGVLLILSGGYTVFNNLPSTLQVSSFSLPRVEDSLDQSEIEEEIVLQAPDFSLKDQDGTLHTLTQYQGKMIFLTFFATWCSNCDRILPVIETLYHEYGNNLENVALIAVAAPNIGREGSEEWIKDYVQQGGYSFPVLMDYEGGLTNQYGIEAIPSTFVINGEGHVIYYIPGAIGEESMRNLIESMK